MEFIVELLKEMAKGIIREGSAYFFRKQFLDKENENNEKPTLDRPKAKLKRWVLLRKNSIITDRLHGYSYSGEMLIASLLFFMHKNS
jgi:exopolysaccharide biosynthesis predicted pyruvyltransferase EpsI